MSSQLSRRSKARSSRLASWSLTPCSESDSSGAHPQRLPKLLKSARAVASLLQSTHRTAQNLFKSQRKYGMVSGFIDTSYGVRYCVFSEIAIRTHSYQHLPFRKGHRQPAHLPAVASKGSFPVFAKRLRIQHTVLLLAVGFATVALLGSWRSQHRHSLDVLVRCDLR